MASRLNQGLKELENIAPFKKRNTQKVILYVTKRLTCIFSVLYPLARGIIEYFRVLQLLSSEHATNCLVILISHQC